MNNSTYKLAFLLSGFLLLSLICFSQAVADSKIVVGNFSQNDMSDWKPHNFQGSTHYTLTKENKRSFLKAVSQSAASGLIKKQQIDLQKTPYLNWQWKVESALYRLTETFKNGDDFAARIYIVSDGGVFFWNTLALNYVWSSGQKSNTVWDNPFTANAKMMAIESGNEFKGQWRSEKRNVLADLRSAFGKDFRFIDAIAIMTDTDNSGQSATAYYGDIYFTDK